MARRQKDDGEVVSLFPFLSILACVIGVLSLMISALALAQMDEGVVERARDFQAVQSQVKEDELEVEALTAAAASIREQLERARAELQALKQQRQRMEARDDADVKLLAESNRLKERIDALTPELKKLLEEIEQLKKEVAKRDEPVESVVQIDPGGSGAQDDLKPHFVECRPGELVIYDGKEPYRLRRDDMRTDKQFLALLNQVAQKASTDRLVFLVRTDAVHTYNLASTFARERQAPNGKLAVTGQGLIDLSKFGM